MGLLARFAGWSGAPWVLLGVVVVLVGSHAWVYGAGKTDGVDQERAAQSEAVAIAIERTRIEHETELRERGWQDASEAAAARAARQDLQHRLAALAALPPKTLIKTVEVTNETGCACAEPRLGSEFWVRYRAAGGERRAADPAAPRAVQD